MNVSRVINDLIIGDNAFGFGNYVDTITLKTSSPDKKDMMRIFLSFGRVYNLYKEVWITTSGQNGTCTSYEMTVYFNNLYLEQVQTIGFYTQTAPSFKLYRAAQKIKGFLE